MTVRVDEGTLDEYAHALRLREQMSKEIVAHEGPSWDDVNPRWREAYREFFSTRQARGEGQLFLARDGDACVGMCLISLAEHYRTPVLGRRYATLNAVYVEPPYRGSGVGKMLTQAAIAWARAHACHVVRLHASVMGEPLYERLGFERTTEMELRLR